MRMIIKKKRPKWIEGKYGVKKPLQILIYIVEQNKKGVPITIEHIMLVFNIKKKTTYGYIESMIKDGLVQYIEGSPTLIKPNEYAIKFLEVIEAYLKEVNDENY